MVTLRIFKTLFLYIQVKDQRNIEAETVQLCNIKTIHGINEE